jgi:crotonobetainyl-CoA:carnitine CoA-transferase CaiB-like acyl-CoA transferase
VAQDELDPGIEEWTAQRTAEDVMETLQGAGVPAGYVQNARDHLADPHLQARGGYVEMDHPVAGPRWYPGNPIRLSETPPVSRRSSLMGEHTVDICRDLLGMPQSEIDSLMSTKAIGF